jgi:hypothetical protein
MIPVGMPGLGVRHPDGVLSRFRPDGNSLTWTPSGRVRHPVVYAMRSWTSSNRVRHAGGGRPDRASLQWICNYVLRIVLSLPGGFLTYLGRVICFNEEKCRQRAWNAFDLFVRGLSRGSCSPYTCVCGLLPWDRNFSFTALPVSSENFRYFWILLIISYLVKFFSSLTFKGWRVGG